MKILLVQRGRTVVCHALLPVGAENIKMVVKGEGSIAQGLEHWSCKMVVKCHLNRGKTDKILLKAKNVKPELGTSICIPAIDLKRLPHKGIEVEKKKTEKKKTLYSFCRQTVSPD